MLDWDAIAGSLRRCSRFVATSYIKTVVNAWTTSRRYHEPILLSCIFGCSGGCHDEDDVSHYLRCPALWGILCYSLHLHPPNMDLPVATLIDLEDIDSPEVPAPLVACLFSIYHFIKRGRQTMIGHDVSEEVGIQAELIPHSVKPKNEQGNAKIGNPCGAWPPFRVNS